MEIWKDVKGYEGYYQVSNEGRVGSLNREIENCNGNKIRRKGIMIKQRHGNRGYRLADLSKNGTTKGFLVQRLVAFNFIDNPRNKLEVNHIDENKDNNNDSNLEWVTRVENANYGTAISRRILNTDHKKRVMNTDYHAIAKKNSKVILQYAITGEVLRLWDSLSDIRRELGFGTSHLSKCCKSKTVNSIAYGYHWEYVGVSYG